MKCFLGIICFINLTLVVNSYYFYHRQEVYRLPKAVKPLRYVLTVEPNLEPDLNPAPYDGSVIIELKAIEDTRNITFNVRNIEIDQSSLTVTGGDNSKIPIAYTENNEQQETYTIVLEKELIHDNNYILTIGKFNSTLGKSNVGFYLATYKNDQGQERRLAVTDFEPNDARRAFPCFDEPGIKARFVINIIRKKEYNSLSNAELEKTIDLGNDRYQDCYKETPEMSAYVVAFIVSDFEPTKLTERHRIFARPGLVKQGKVDYTLDTSVKTLKVLEDFTGIKFPINKMDQFAIPDRYFKDEAMENWALVIYGESHLFCTNTSTSEDMKRCTAYIAHEFGHQWFGNLITPSWWTYTWLSEGFAGYFQYYVASIVQPSWRLMDQLVIDNVHSSLERDNQGATSGTLNYKISYNGEFPTLWLLYHKGSSVIRMMDHFLTHQVFQQGLRNFLEARKFQAAEPSHLYDGLQAAVDKAGVNHLLGGLNVSTILTSWTDQVGYPLVSVERNYTTGSLTFSQIRFIKLRTGTASNTETLWHIPINYAYGSSSKDKFTKTAADFWLSEREKQIETDIPIDDWYLVNLHETGYYRVNYDLSNWERLINVLKSDRFEEIPVLNRAQLLDDAYDLARNKHIPFNIALELGEYLVREKDLIPFGAFLSFTQHMEHILPYQSPTNNRSKFLYFGDYNSPNVISESNEEFNVFKEYAKYILNPIFEHIGFEEKPTDDHLDKLYRAKIVTALCDYKHVGCTNEAIKMFQRFKNGTTNYIPPDLQTVVFCRGISSKEDWEFVAKLYTARNTDEILRRRLYEGLGCNYQYGIRSMLTVEV